MTVKDLIAKLQAQDSNAKVNVAVGWAKDTAVSDDGDTLLVRVVEDGAVVISGWMSDCGASLDED